MRTTDRTGVEMEALTAVSVAALTVVDMVKAVDQARGHHRRPGRVQDRRQERRLAREPSMKATVVARLQPRGRRGLRGHHRAADRGGARRELGFEVTGPVVVPDGEPVGEAIRAAVAGGARAVLTTGGTGLTPTDLTPEVTRALLDREVPGIAEAIRAYGVARACRRRPCRAGWPAWPVRRWW